MIKLPDGHLKETTNDHLKKLQKEVRQSGSYSDQVEQAKKRWDTRNNKKENKACFDEVKEVLSEMCQGARRCVYCEDSLADEVEHIKPKNLYPELVFTWENYLFACGPCNGKKSAHFAVWDKPNQRIVDITRAKDAAVVEPQAGLAMFIDPRMEDPLEHMRMDLSGTFVILPRGNKQSIEFKRAEYTIKTLSLEEGNASHLTTARKQAFENFKSRLNSICEEKESGRNITQSMTLFKEMNHWSVWLEMKRQRQHYPELVQLFERIPEALDW